MSQINFQPNKTYKTRANAEKAVTTWMTEEASKVLRWFITTSDDGRFFPVFIFNDAANLYSVHFHFCCVN